MPNTKKGIAIPIPAFTPVLRSFEPLQPEPEEERQVLLLVGVVVDSTDEGLVFEDETETKFDELEVRSAWQYRKTYSAVDSMLPVPWITVSLSFQAAYLQLLKA